MANWFDQEGDVCQCEWHQKQREKMASRIYQNANAPTVSIGGLVPEKRIVDPQTGGMKNQKPCQIGAMDPKALMEVGLVAGFGTEKYERYNFAKGYKWSLNYDALQRHLNLFWAGEDRDGESGLYHLAHACWHCLALLTFQLRGKGTDDRFPV